ncbi:MAG: FAD:protein FMN transferase [Flavobacteriales bacterium Tduv]
MAITLLIGCRSNFNFREFRGYIFGTYYNIKYSGHQNYSDSIDNIFKQFNHSLSTYSYESDISKINRGDNNIRIDSYFETVLKKSQEIYKISGGAFDPTLGILVNAWGFGPEINEIIPNATKLKELMKYVGLNQISLKDGKIIKPRGVLLDFNAIAKGYVVDVISQYLEGQGIKNYMVEIGGEIRAKGEKASGKPWMIGIEKPVENQKLGENIIFNLPLRDCSLATSGNYRKFKIDHKTGRKYVHTIDHKTGYPIISDLLSVSVLAKDCMTADGYATAFMALGVEKSKEFLKAHENLNLEAYFIYVDKVGNLHTLRTFHERMGIKYL